MLFQLQSLDVVNGQCNAANKHDGQCSKRSLDVETASEGNTSDHESTHSASQTQQAHDISIYPMEQQSFIPYDGYKLKASQKARRDDGVQVHPDPHLTICLRRVGVALSRGRLSVDGLTEDAMVVKQHEASETKAHEGTEADEPEDEVVAFGEADGVVDVSHEGDEAIGGGLGGCSGHLGKNRDEREIERSRQGK